MGKPTGFLEYERQSFLYREVEERIKDAREIYIPREEEELKRQGARCMDCGIPFCHALGCPLENFIPDWNDAAYRGHWKQAYELLSLTNPMPEITGRVCPAPCEASCTLSINDSPVTIKQLELAIIEKAFEYGWVRDTVERAETGKRIAIIGSGPAGLAAASRLREYGHMVTVFEREDKPGGLLRYGIPSFKLEKKFLDRRIDLLERKGVEFETLVTAGEDLSARYLKRKYDVLLLTTGCTVPRDLPVQGRDYEGVYFAMEYLVQPHGEISGPNFSPDNKGSLEEPARKKITAKDKRVLVIGGGDTGADCVGTAVRQGAREVHQFEIMPEPEEWNSPSNPNWPAWPKVKRTSTSHEEGCIRRWGVETIRLSGIGVKVQRGHFQEVVWEKGRDGRHRPRRVGNSEFTLDVDMVLLAMGFVSAEEGRLIKDLGVDLDKAGRISHMDGSMTSVPGAFTAGDSRTGTSLVVRAMKDGLDAAEAVHAGL